jgi:hypothetical protein
METHPVPAGPASRGRRQGRARAWRAEVENAKLVYERFIARAADLDELAQVAPALVDSEHAGPFSELLDAVAAPEIERRPRLALARARQHVVLGHRVAARTLCATVLSSAAGDDALLARACWELGCLELADDQVASAQLVLDLGSQALGTSAEGSPDLLHLNALIAERGADRATAVRCYREAIARGEHALTLLTRVIALRNLAGALAHDDPRSAAGLCGLALALLDGDGLDERMRPSIENILAYSLLCEGEVVEALRHADAAATDARRLGHPLVECYARFNSCIAKELLGSTEDAESALGRLEETTAEQGLDELRGWIRLRRAWLAVKLGHADDGARQLDRHFANDEGTLFSESISTLRAILAYRAGRFAESIGTLQRLVERYAHAEDWLTTFTLLLWLACVHDLGGDSGEAESAIEAAASIGRPRRFRLSPNWWSDELVTIARRLLPETDAAFGRLLVTTGQTVGTMSAPRVAVSRSGDITVEGRLLADERWREGRTGSRVLRRLFRALVSAHPVGIQRDELADLLWPESDGDRAAQNLDSALNDLRHLLRSVVGLRVGSKDGRYRLLAGPSAMFEGAEN